MGRCKHAVDVWPTFHPIGVESLDDFVTNRRTAIDGRDQGHVVASSHATIGAMKSVEGASERLRGTVAVRARSGHSKPHDDRRGCGNGHGCRGAMSMVASPIGWPYLVTGLPVEIGRTAILCPGWNRSCLRVTDCPRYVDDVIQVQGAELRPRRCRCGRARRERVADVASDILVSIEKSFLPWFLTPADGTYISHFA